MAATLTNVVEGHFVAVTLCAGQVARKVGDHVPAGVSFEEWVRRKITQHLAVVCSETTTWEAKYTSAAGVLQVSPDVYDLERALCNLRLL